MNTPLHLPSYCGDRDPRDGWGCRTVIDLDDKALEEAAKELGTTTKRDTVNTALREVTARYRRLRALEEARELVADGALDMNLLLDKHAYRPTGAAGDNRGTGAGE